MKAKAAGAPGVGWSPTPNLLYRRQRELGLTNNEISLTLHVSSYQRSLKELPYPKNSRIANDMGVSVSSIKRWKEALIRKGYLVVSVKKRSDGGDETTYWDFSPLWVQLQEVAPGTQIPLFPERKSDGGMVLGSKGNVSDPKKGVAHARSTPWLMPDPPRSSGLSHQEEEAIEAEAFEEEKTTAAHAADAGASDLAGASLSDSNGEVPEFSVGSNDRFRPEPFGVFEQITPDFGGVDLTDEDKKRIEEVITAAKARNKVARESVQTKREARRAAMPGAEQREVKKTALKRLLGLEAVWKAELEQAFPDVLIGKWTGKDFGMVKNLLKPYDDRTDVIADTFRYVIRNWGVINKKLFKGEATTPTLGMILKLHQKFVFEAQQWSKIQGVIDERDEFFRANPNLMSVPAELDAKLAEAEKVLKTLGLK